MPAALLARFVAVGIPISALAVKREFTPHTIKLLTWGGLRGGISVALALYLGTQLSAAAATTALKVEPGG